MYFFTSPHKNEVRVLYSTEFPNSIYTSFKPG